MTETIAPNIPAMPGRSAILGADMMTPLLLSSIIFTAFSFFALTVMAQNQGRPRRTSLIYVKPHSNVRGPAHILSGNACDIQ
jgi:hypothetical protein